ncbi:hypothetical protein [Mycobacterium sp. AZCC_0083]|uniref:hypothetical protein n=1 Tax=Mycobacterium sp. AZCC_0083 TaxID=2735882 RepID=UPI0017992C7B|nr:hypothetical protein [Mycobacterium sp. AZCC_0083]MBB5161291.1 hypothetical protein [Mycobacterium sp. AZCC_0083]
MVFDGAHRQRQALCDGAVGQSVPDQHHDLALTVGQRQPLDGWAKGRSPGATAPLGKRLRSNRTCKGRPTQVLPAIHNARISGGIGGRLQITHPFEIL